MQWAYQGSAMGGYNPERLIESYFELFRKNFKTVVRIEKIDEARATNAELVAVFDLFVEVKGSAKFDTSVMLFTLDKQQIDVVRGQSDRPIPLLGGSSGPWKIIEAASEEARNSLETSLRESAKMAQFSQSQAGGSTTVAAKPQAPQTPSLLVSDVDRLPAAKGRLNKQAYAIVIGIETYRNKLPKAEFADRDAKLVGEYLTKVLGYPEENVVVRTNDNASLTDLIKYVENWLPNNVEKDSVVFIYYSGHGAPNPKTSDAYLVPYDGDPTFLESTGYPLKRLYAALEKLPAKDITVVLDSCFSGAGGRSVLAKGAKPMVLSVENAIVAGGKAVVLSASAGDQISSAFVEQGHGLLTYFFLKGLQGEGDLNHDGTIGLAELYEYVKPNVQRIARKQYNNEQTPQLLASPELLRKGGGTLVEQRKP
nr:caspase family protein [Nitrospirota bacterium]